MSTPCGPILIHLQPASEIPVQRIECGCGWRWSCTSGDRSLLIRAVQEHIISRDPANKATPTYEEWLTRFPTLVAKEDDAQPTWCRVCWRDDLRPRPDRCVPDCEKER